LQSENSQKKNSEGEKDRSAPLRAKLRNRRTSKKCGKGYQRHEEKKSFGKEKPYRRDRKGGEEMEEKVFTT